MNIIPCWYWRLWPRIASSLNISHSELMQMKMYPLNMVDTTAWQNDTYVNWRIGRKAKIVSIAARIRKGLACLELLWKTFWYKKRHDVMLQANKLTLTLFTLLINCILAYRENAQYNAKKNKRTRMTVMKRNYVNVITIYDGRNQLQYREYSNLSR